MFPFLHFLPVELHRYIARILKRHQLFKIREKLDQDGVFERHVIIANYISNTRMYRIPFTPPPADVIYLAKDAQEESTTSLIFQQTPTEPQVTLIELTGTTINLKDIREVAATQMKGKKIIPN